MISVKNLLKIYKSGDDSVRAVDGVTIDVGDDFVAVVEFGDTVKARAVTAGGESGNTSSKHFNDEAKRYSTGDLREVYFYKSQLKGHTEREYHPGS